MHFVCVLSDCGLWSEIELDLSYNDIFVDIPVGYPVLILGWSFVAGVRHFSNVWWVDKFYEDIW